MDNEYEFRIFGIKRSGNHSVLAGIISTFNSNEVYLHNNVQKLSDIFINDQNKNSGRRPFNNTDTDFFGRLANRLVDEKLYTVENRLSKKKCLIHTYEDRPLSLITDINKLNLGSSKYLYNIIVLRDPYNTLASRETFIIKNPDIQKRPITRFLNHTDTMNLWKQYAKEFLGITNNISNKICINYNKLTTDLQYKKDVYCKMNLDTDKLDDNIVLNFGRGSSFIGHKLEPNKNEYNERWKKVDVSKFIDDEATTLSNTIFGVIKK